MMLWTAFTQRHQNAILRLPNAVRIAVLVDPNNPTITKTTVQDVQKAAPIMGLQTQIINATTVGEINEVFAAFERDRPDALFVAPDSFLTSRRVQLAALDGARQDSSDLSKP